MSAEALNRIAVIVVAGMLCAPAAQAQQPLDKVSFGTNWVAEGEHGGHYQALVDGTYKRYGLDVTIVPGGPNVNNRILLPVGKLDFFMAANTLQSFDAVEQNIPTLAVAAMFQKEPQVLMAHPDQGIDKFEDLKKLTLFISREGLASYFQYLKADFGFSEAQVKPYTSNAQPFLADKRSAMQGYVTSEPYAIEKQAHFKPKVFLIADQGFNSYSTLIETRRDLVEKRPDLVQRFVDASIIGWANYLYGDNKAANALIKKQNPEMTDELLAYSRRQDEGIRHRRFRRRRDARHRRHDRRADEQLLRQDGARRRGQAVARARQVLHAAVRQQEGTLARARSLLYAAVREQEGRPRPAPEAVREALALARAAAPNRSRCNCRECLQHR